MKLHETPEIKASLVARRHHGVITRAQAMEAGLTAAQIRRLVAHGTWQPAGRGVYVVSGAPCCAEQRLAVALALTYHQGLVSHLSAAWLHGSPTGRRRIPTSPCPGAASSTPTAASCTDP